MYIHKCTNAAWRTPQQPPQKTNVAAFPQVHRQLYNCSLVIIRDMRLLPFLCDKPLRPLKSPVQIMFDLCSSKSEVCMLNQNHL